MPVNGAATRVDFWGHRWHVGRQSEVQEKLAHDLRVGGGGEAWNHTMSTPRCRAAGSSNGMMMNANSKKSMKKPE